MPNHSKPSKRLHPSGEKAAVAKSPDKDLAAKLRAAALRKEIKARSTVGLYSLRVKEKDGVKYGLPFCAVSDHFALLAQKQLLPCSDCFKVGSFCLSDGETVALKSPVLILDNKVSENEK